MKIFMFFINAILWLWLFIVPVGIFGLLSLWLYMKSTDNLVYSIMSAAVGIGSGFVLAEHIRRKYGLNNFFSRLRATPDVDGFDPLENKNRNQV